MLELQTPPKHHPLIKFEYFLNSILESQSISVKLQPQIMLPFGGMSAHSSVG